MPCSIATASSKHASAGATRPKVPRSATPDSPNELWCADYKGEFLLGNRQYCYPLTITDYRSRYLLACEGLESTKETFAFTVFERTFKDYGLPEAIRTDNGVPFAHLRAVRLSQAVGLVAAPRHRPRAHQAGQSAAERPP